MMIVGTPFGMASKNDFMRINSVLFRFERAKVIKNSLSDSFFQKKLPKNH
jgi:hypothetical protein